MEDEVVKKIGKIEDLDAQIIDCEGKIVCPMFVDGHERIVWQDIYKPEDIAKVGVGTLVGCLANEEEHKSALELFEIAKKLREEYGLETYCLTGSKKYFEDVTDDIVNNDFVIGTKTALFQPQRAMGKEYLTYEKLKEDAVRTYNAGLASGKTVQLHMHLDHPFARGERVTSNQINSGKLDNFGWIDKIVEETGVLYSLFKLTHAQKFYNRIFDYAKRVVILTIRLWQVIIIKGLTHWLKQLKTKQII